MYEIFIPLLAAMLHSIMNVLDKFVVAHRVKSAIGYAVVVGIANVILAIVLACFLSWHGVTLSSMVVPIIIGLLYAGNLFLYLQTLETEDISHVAGLLYLYPLVVALLSFIFLHERLSLIEYVGASLAIFGAVLLSMRFQKIKLEASVWLFVGGIFLVAFIEFLMKVATTSIDPFNGAVITSFSFGLGAALCILLPKVRAAALPEMHNLGWAFLPQAFELAGTSMLFWGMSLLPATIVSSLAAVQPLFVILFEWIAERHVGNMVKDRELMPKLIAIGTIVAGVALMYSVHA